MKTKRRRCLRCRRLSTTWKHGRLCPEHYLADLKIRRRYRRQLNFCWHCLRRALPGLTVCAKHRAIINKSSVVYRWRQTIKRGWKMEKVAVER